ATKVDRFHPDRRRGEDRRRRLVPTSITTPRRSIAFTPTDDRRRGPPGVTARNSARRSIDRFIPAANVARIRDAAGPSREGLASSSAPR
ncbi:MAG TPA: hypothetical protein VMV69_01655, partial [Pirellulales bacterium]|nr:hypothetical protein [Pirellulales bacterium]